jgi:hypothetical protein
MMWDIVWNERVWCGILCGMSVYGVGYFLIVGSRTVFYESRNSCSSDQLNSVQMNQLRRKI